MTPTTRTFTCTVLDAGLDVASTFQVSEGRALTDALAGRPNAPIQVGCRGGGCGVCRVQVIDGEYTPRRMSRRFVSEPDQVNGVALACRLLPAGDLTVRVDPSPPRQPSGEERSTE